MNPDKPGAERESLHKQYLYDVVVRNEKKRQKIVESLIKVVFAPIEPKEALRLEGALKKNNRRGDFSYYGIVISWSEDEYEEENFRLTFQFDEARGHEESEKMWARIQTWLDKNIKDKSGIKIELE